MSSKYINNSNYAGSGYTLNGVHSGVTIGPAGSIGGVGVIGGTNAAYTIVNQGRIGVPPSGAYGVELQVGGTVINSGTIAGGSNSGTGVWLSNGGSVSNNGGLIEGYNGVLVSDGSTTPGSLTNSGTIAATGIDGIAAYLFTGSVNNLSGALIEGYDGVLIQSTGMVTNSGTIAASSISIHLNSGTVSNTGTVTSTGGQVAVVINTGGYVNNQSGGVIEGNGGVQIGSGTVANSGTIAATGAAGYGVKFLNTGSVNNRPGGVIEGNVGVYFGNTGSVVNAGAINGSGGVAIDFAGTSNLLALEHGYSLGGTVQAGVADTLELLGAAGAVTVGFDSHGLNNFGIVTFGPSSGNSETLAITETSGTVPATIYGFAGSLDVIDLTEIGTDGTISNIDPIAHRLTIAGSGGTLTLQFDPSTANAFSATSDGSNGTEIIACFSRGTLILTDFGEIPVEDLAIGDQVMTHSGAVRPIRWIGRRAYAGRFVAGNRAVLPICVAAGALDDGVPARNLWVSPEHALHIDDALVPARYLVNGMTIVQPDSIALVEYFHLELDDHDVIFADGAAAETFVDCDNRLMFANGAEYALRYPKDDRPRWAFCATRLEPGAPALSAIRARLLQRAEIFGHVLDTDPDLCLVVNDATLAPVTVMGAVYRFEIPAASAAVWLESRSAIPAETDAESGDTRRLGVAVERIVLSDANLSIEAWHGHPALRDGFYQDEPSHRWTDGCAKLPKTLLRAFDGAYTVEVHLLANCMSYRVDAPRWTSTRRAA